VKPHSWADWKNVLRAAIGLAACALVACDAEGSYELSWRFDDQAGPDQAAPASAGSCAARGVVSFQVVLDSDSGAQESFETLCGVGSVERKAPVGNWTATLTSLDAQGVAFPSVADGTPVAGRSAVFEISAGGPPVRVDVVVPATDSCRDRIDNDHNGAVDQGDPGCIAAGVEASL